MSLELKPIVDIVRTMPDGLDLDELANMLRQCESCENWFASGVESIGATGPMCPGCRGADTSDEDNAGYNRTVREGLKL